MGAIELWAQGQFGHAELGDERRTRRAVEMAAQVARRPAGVVSQVFSGSAEREGAFRLLENDGFRHAALLEAARRRTIEDCVGHETVIVPLDGSSLTLSSNEEREDLGGVGAWSSKARGVQVMTGLAVSMDGRALGLCGQRYWVRESRSTGTERCARPDSESRYWLEVLAEVDADFADAGGARPWFQMDRGADCWPVLKYAVESGALVTVRAAHDRNLETEAKLWSTLQRAPIRARKKLSLPARGPRPRKKRVGKRRVRYRTSPRRKRTAHLVIRVARVRLVCAISRRKTAVVELNAVYVRERGASDDNKIEWMLLTTHPIETRKDVLRVVDAYARRWRIEDFHRAWKEGLCGVERTQLRSREAIFKWATILATVATRAMRLTHLARETPEALATSEFSTYELQAIIGQRQPKGVGLEVIPTLPLQQAVRWMVDVVGYAGPWKGPPGATLVGRGLELIMMTARGLENLENLRKKR